MAFVRAVALAYRTAGQDVSAALRRARISKPQLQQPDGHVTAIQFEALCDFAVWTHQRQTELVLTRVKDTVRDVLAQVDSPDLPALCYAPWSVDDAVQQLV